MTAPLRIAIAGRFYWHNGSSHALLGYVRAAQRLGLDVRASHLGIVDEIVQQKVPTADADWKADLLVMVCEERFLEPEARKKIEVLYPRSRRILIDPDGRYSPLIDVGNDANHPTPESRAEWVADFDELSDVIVQPSIGAPAPGTQRFLYFGVDTHRKRPARSIQQKTYDIVYVGTNWYRWRDIVWLVEGLSAVRDRVERIAIFGQWWTGESAEGCEAETYSTPEYLRNHSVETLPSAPFDDVEMTMGSGRLSPILIRPVLSALEMATPRMFETFVANTVPVLPPYFRYASALYGEGVAPLILPEAPAPAIGDLLDNYADSVALAEEIASKLTRDHSYERRLSQLVEIGIT
jgi:glycosyltransferase involved in cell wall biosynthesis